MSLTPGTRLGPYEVLSLLGVGGMGVVYRAHDTKLNRDVAIKVLLPAVANDPDRLARFGREAQVLASLNHPNIAHIYGIEDAAIVMELVDGEDLAQRIARGPIPLDEALPIARQIAEALEAAHDHGIIHRDLKPANVKVRPDGTVKVLDFGLAKAMDQGSGIGDQGSGGAANSPTLSIHATEAGLILGTAAYMSPEQARGKPVDKRADIWSYGVVLYEMLTGQRAFKGDDVSETLASVLKDAPAFDALPASTPPRLRRILERCLERDAKARLRDIGEARVELAKIASGDGDLSAARGTMAVSVAAAPRWRRAVPWVAGAGVVSVVTALAVWTAMRPEPARPQPVQRYPITLPASAPYIGEGVALSPDGTHLVYAALEAGTRVLYLRNLGQLDAQPIRGTDGAFNPFFSADGEWIGFFTAPGTAVGKLKKVAVRGGPPLTLADANNPTGAWLADDTIVFGRFTGTEWSLFRVPAAGGVAIRLTNPDSESKEVRHGWPEALPSGNHILFTIAPRAGLFDDARIAVLSLATGQYHTVVEQGYHARYVPTGHLVYMLSGNLMAVPFDVKRLETTGPPVPVVEGVRGRSDVGEAGFAVSRTGFLVYAPGVTSVGAQRTLVWVDRTGREEPITAPARNYTYLRVSPDGTRVALDIRDQENDIWVWDLTRQNLTRLTFDPRADRSPVWTLDGRRIFFSSQRASAEGSLYWQASDGTGQAERLVESPNQQLPQAVSPDGKQLLFRDLSVESFADVDMLSLDDRKVTPLLQTTFGEQNPDVSPDGRWIAYESNESGANEIYVRPFPAVDTGRWQVSTGGGTRPVWARSGRELFYVVGADAVRMMALPVQTGATFSAGTPRVLFEGRYVATPDRSGRTYDVSPDGQRFLMIKNAAVEVTTSLVPSFVFVLNWFDELRRIAPVAKQ